MEELKVVHEGEWSHADARHWIRLLNTLIKQRGGLRPAHLYADLAIVMLAHHVSEYANAVLLVLESDVPGTAYPLLRAGFEAELDVLYLVTSGSEFDLVGARAYVAARVSDYAFVGSQRRAAASVGASWPKTPTVPLRERLRQDAATWNRLAPEKGQLIWQAYDLVKASRRAGLKHWTGLSRADLHAALQTRLNESMIEAVFHGMYDQMASRSHSGMRFGHYLEFGERIKLASKPAVADPFPLQALGSVLDTTVAVLARHFVEQPIGGGASPA